MGHFLWEHDRGYSGDTPSLDKGSYDPDYRLLPGGGSTQPNPFRPFSHSVYVVVSINKGTPIYTPK